MRIKHSETSMTDLLTTGQFGKEVCRTAKCIRDWINNGTIPDSAVEIINKRYHVRRWAIEEVKS
jgi:hypothetical protein